MTEPGTKFGRTSGDRQAKTMLRRNSSANSIRADGGQADEAVQSKQENQYFS
jgi:hypothetical protein